MTESWEHDFSPDPDTTVCQQCGQLHISEASFAKVVWMVDQELTLYFCSRRCSHEYYLDRLRESL